MKIESGSPEYVNSPSGEEVLADFAAQAVRTRSRTAAAALAVVFANPGANAERKARIALGLEGISERSIETFLRLYHEREALNLSEGKLRRISDATIANLPSLSAITTDGDEWVNAIDDLLARGLV